MYNWAMNKQITMEKTKNAIMGELETILTEESGNITANYWIDNCHNIFASIIDDGIERFLDIRVELYDCIEEYVGDLYVYDTVDISKESLERTAREIVMDYYGELT